MPTTFADLLDHALAYAGDDALKSASVRHRRAVQTAYRVVASKHTWAYLWTLGRLNTVAPYATGTVAYTHTGGAYERVLTLTSGTWPTWAGDGFVVIANVPYEVDERKSGTQVTLTAASNPGADVAALTEYQLMQDQYPLPVDFVSGDEVVVNSVGTVMEYRHLREWSSERRVGAGPGQPLVYSFLGDRDRLGKLKMVMWPPPDAAYQLDYLYRRSPRPMRFETVSTGTATIAGGGTTVTGTGTAFTAAMVGSVIRLGSDNQVLPTGRDGGSPYAYEGVITGFTSATALTVSPAAEADLTDVALVVSDPADVDDVSMFDYLLREIEYQWRILARSKVDKLDEDSDYQLALTRAMEADSRNTNRGAAMRRACRRTGFSHYPMIFNG